VGLSFTVTFRSSALFRYAYGWDMWTFRLGKKEPPALRVSDWIAMTERESENHLSTRSSNRGAFLLIMASVGPFVTGYLSQLAGLHEYREWRVSFHIGTAQLLGWVLVVLMLVHHHLRSSGESWRDLGLCFKWWVLPAAVITVAAWCVLWFGWTHILMRFVSFDESDDATVVVIASLSHSPLVIAVLYALVVPCYEELIWRAFLITRLERAGWHWSIAVIASTALQLTMHMYHGFEVSLLYIPQFLTASLFFVFFRNVYVLIIAHLLLNAISAAGNT
jgi:membrane protease YdiL (CAAX protease family)